ncbi:hypothetical protein GUJ93_ZPchr0013g37971 [Zizania palustris]|uniref:BHLH domain-containing protein n=1 Tax=Zizania palustris TaxID=103762 RepID=A0A8J6C395_ZIZPA|nr:hypothetical protein GUJ93_ZPchr0013g37971 [Zizania palustris]
MIYVDTCVYGLSACMFKTTESRYSTFQVAQEAKRLKSMKSTDNNDNLRTEAEINLGNSSKAANKNDTPPEPPRQDYIHVRARRGQATDNHSLAERARREKISERMKILQDLVPGCNKVIGKASALDEIINYIQSLQSQVEFLSMKLEAINTHMNNESAAFPSKDFGAQPYNTAHDLTFNPHSTSTKGICPGLDARVASHADWQCL